MFGTLSRINRIGVLALILGTGAMLLSPTAVSAAERGYGRDHPSQNFDRRWDFGRGHVRFSRDFDHRDRGWVGRSYFGRPYARGRVIEPVPEYVPMPEYVPAPYGYTNYGYPSAPAPIYSAPGCNNSPYGSPYEN